MTIFSALSSLFLPSNSEPIRLPSNPEPVRLKWVNEVSLPTSPEATLANETTLDIKSNKSDTLDSAPSAQALYVLANEVQPYLCLKKEQRCFNIDTFAAEFASEIRSEYRLKCIGLDIGLVMGSLNSTLEDEFHATICGIEYKKYNNQFQITNLSVHKERSENVSEKSVKYEIDVSQIISITVIPNKNETISYKR